MPKFLDIWQHELKPLASLFIHDQFTMDNVQNLCEYTYDRAQAVSPQPEIQDKTNHRERTLCR
jgi:hypothetical protein